MSRTTINSLSADYLDLRERIAALAAERDAVLLEIGRRLEASKRYADDEVRATRYEVAATRVRGYLRGGFTAVRVTEKRTRP